MYREKNEGDGLYYTRLQGMNPVATEYCHKVTTTDNDKKSTNWKIVESKEKKCPSSTREEAHTRWGHPDNDQLNKVGNSQN